MHLLLADQVAVITGGARGIGLGIAIRARRGGRAGRARRSRRGRCDRPRRRSATAARQRASAPLRIAPRSSRSPRTGRATHRRIHILAANAGIYPNTDFAAHRRRALGPRDGYQRQGRGPRRRRPASRHARTRATAASSCAPTTRARSPGRPASRTTAPRRRRKLGLMRSLAVESPCSGVTVNAVMPGNVETPGLPTRIQEHRTRMLSADPDGSLRPLRGRRLCGALPRLAPTRRTSPDRRSIGDGGQVCRRAPGANSGSVTPST